MNESAIAPEVKRTGIVLGLYIAALLLAGPLHPLMHEGGAATVAPECGNTRAAFTFHEVHLFDYSPHSCPACFLHSHPALGDDLTIADVEAEFESTEISIVESEVVTHVAHSPISSRAPPHTL